MLVSRPRTDSIFHIRSIVRSTASQIAPVAPLGWSVDCFPQILQQIGRPTWSSAPFFFSLCFSCMLNFKSLWAISIKVFSSPPQEPPRISHKLEIFSVKVQTMSICPLVNLTSLIRLINKEFLLCLITPLDFLYPNYVTNETQWTENCHVKKRTIQNIHYRLTFSRFFEELV